MREPVQTKYGSCYEETALKKCLKINGMKDPVSSLPINPKTDITKNLALKKLINDYLKKNPWTFEKNDDSIETENQIEFQV